MPQEPNLPAICETHSETHDFYMSKNQCHLFREIQKRRPFKNVGFSDYFRLATVFIHQLREHLLDGRAVYMVSCGGVAVPLELRRVDIYPVHTRFTLPAAIRMTSDMWAKVEDIGCDLGHFRIPQPADKTGNRPVPPLPPEWKMAVVMSSIWDMYLDVCVQVLMDHHRVLVPSYRAALGWSKDTGEILAEIEGARARTIRLV